MKNKNLWLLLETNKQVLVREFVLAFIPKAHYFYLRDLKLRESDWKNMDYVPLNAVLYSIYDVRFINYDKL